MSEYISIALPSKLTYSSTIMLQRSTIITWSIGGILILIATIFEIIFWFGTPETLYVEDNDYPGEYVQVHDLNIHYEVSGSGPAVALFHSGGWSSVEYTDVVAELNEEYTVYTIDLPGFGYSDKPQVSYTVPYMAEQIPAILEALPESQFHVVGASANASAVLLAATEEPDTISTVSVISPIGFGPDINQAAIMAQIPLAGELLAHANEYSFDVVLDRGAFVDTAIDDAMREILYEDSRLPKASRAKLGLLRNTTTTRTIEEDLQQQMVEAAPRVSQPVQIIWGEADTYAHYDQHEYALELLPKAKFHSLKETGHFAHIEQPDTVSTLLSQFMMNPGKGKKKSHTK